MYPGVFGLSSRIFTSGPRHGNNINLFYLFLASYIYYQSNFVGPSQQLFLIIVYTSPVLSLNVLHLLVFKGSLMFHTVCCYKISLTIYMIFCYIHGSLLFKIVRRTILIFNEISLFSIYFTRLLSFYNILRLTNSYKYTSCLLNSQILLTFTRIL